MRIPTRTATLLASIVPIVLLAACGGGGGGGGAMNNEPATVGVLVMDAPSGQWDQAIATITSVTLIGNSGQVTLFTGSETLDLLQLGDFSELFAVSEAVPPGQYSKIRLHLADLVLNDLDATGAVIESVHPQLVGNGKLDLNPREPFTIAPGAVLFVELDFDMDKSLKITETGNGKIIVRPVVFVNIRSGQADGRLSRIHGDITELDAAAGTLLLCQTDFASRWDGHDDDSRHFGTGHCVRVRTDGSTGIFGADGLPEDFAGLAVGEEATAIGRLQRLDIQNMGGEHRLAMDAAVIEEGALGTFTRIAGTAASGVDALTSQFGLDVAPGQGIATDAALPVQLYEHSRIFNRRGEELTRDDITAGRSVLADGVLQVGAVDLLRSPLVILDAGPPPGETVLRGDVLAVDTATGSVTMTTASGDRCVDAAAADVFLVSHADGLSFTRGALSDLHAGQNIAAFGTEGPGGCLTADTILAEE